MEDRTFSGKRNTENTFSSKKKKLILKKVTAIILSGFMVIALLPVDVMADEVSSTESALETPVEEGNEQTLDLSDAENVQEIISDADLTEAEAFNEAQNDTLNDTILEEAAVEEPVEDIYEELLPDASEETTTFLSEEDAVSPEVPETPMVPLENQAVESDVSLLAVNDLEEDAAPIDGKEVFDSLFGLIPSETAQTVAHPYGYGDNVSAIIKRSKRMLFQTSDRSDNHGYVGWNRGYKADFGSNPTSTRGDGYGSYAEGVTWYNTMGDLYSEIGKAGTLAFMQAVPFDPTGCGLNDYIAYYGVQRDGDKNEDYEGYESQLWILNTHTRKLSHLYTVSSHTEWQRRGLDAAEYYGRNFTAITAGDYDGDGRDTLVVYYNTDDGMPHVVELAVKIGNTSQNDENAGSIYDDAIHIDPMGGTDRVFDPEFIVARDIHKFDKNTDPTLRMGCSLATGDVNCDGLDDLVVVSSQNSTNSDATHSKSYMSVCFGSQGKDGNRKSVFEPNEYMGTFLTDNGVSMCAAGVDIGDVNGDNLPDIIVAGAVYEGNTRKDGEMIIAGYSLYHGGTDLQCWAWMRDSSYWKVAGTCRGNAKVTCVAFDGPGHPEFIGIDSRIYRYEDKKFIKFDFSRWGEEYYKDDVGYNVGNFAATYIFDPKKVNNDEPNAQSAFQQYTVTHMTGRRKHWEGRIYYGNAYYDDNGVFHPTTEIMLTKGDVFDYDVSTEGKKSTLNALMVPFESAGDEAVLVRLTHSKIVPQRYVSKGTPIPVVVLQAAPYFKDTGKEYAGATTYGTVEINGEGSTDIDNWYIGGGFKGDLTFPCVRASASIIAKYSHTKTVTNLTTRKFTSTFTANANDTVVVRLSPTDMYTYDVKWGLNSDWKEAALGYTLKREPIYQQITVDEYNAMAGYYNELIKTPKVCIDDSFGQQKEVTVQAPKLELIDKAALYLGNVGNPSGYPQTGTNKVPTKWETISKNAYALGHDGGSTTSNFSKETTKNVTTNNCAQEDFRFDIQYGLLGEIGTPRLLWLGISVVSGGMQGHGKVTLTGDGEQIQGTVKNLDVSKNAAFKNYSFNWMLGRSTYLMQTDNSNKLEIPVVGYSLDTIQKGLGKPKITSLDKSTGEQGETKVTIHWDAPQEVKDGANISYYQIYAYDIDGNRKLLGKTDRPDQLSWVFERTNEDFVSFTVLPIGQGVLGSLTQGIESDKKSVFFVGKGDPGEKGEKGDKGDQGIQGEKGDKGDQGIQGEKGDKGDQGIQGEKGDKGDQGIQGEKGDKGDQGIQGEKGDKGDQGIQGIPGKDAYQLALSLGFVGTLEDWLLFLHGKDGVDGRDGKDGADGKNGRDGHDGLDGRDGQDGANGRDGQDGTNGRDGRDGANGRDGRDGLDGRNGQDGTNGRDGRDGLDGHDGRDGINGANGKSAYEIAVEYGFKGTEQEWLESLKGEDGSDGNSVVAKVDGIPYAYLTEDDVLIIPLEDGREVMVGTVEPLTNDSSNRRLVLKKVQGDNYFWGIIRMWLPLIIALLSLLWNAVDLYFILSNDRRTKLLAKLIN